MESSQYSIFKDSIASQLFKDPEFKTAADELDEFASYLAAEAWTIVPERYRSVTFEERSSVEDGAQSISLDAISPSFVDTLVSYGQAQDTDDAARFLRKALESYVEQVTAPPPVWSSTRTKECEICEREVPLTYHHLIPKSTHAKVLKKGWHPESMLNKVAWLCRPCHSVVHSVARGEELAQHYHTVDLLLAREDIRRWQKYASKQRFGVKRG